MRKEESTTNFKKMDEKRKEESTTDFEKMAVTFFLLLVAFYLLF